MSWKPLSSTPKKKCNKPKTYEDTLNDEQLHDLNLKLISFWRSVSHYNGYNNRQLMKYIKRATNQALPSMPSRLV